MKEVTEKMISKMTAETKYIEGAVFKTHSVRNYIVTIQNKELKGKVIIKSVYTPRISEHEWGEGEVSYYIEGTDKAYKTLFEAIKSLTL